MPLVEGILLSLDFRVGTPPALYTLGFSRPLLTQQHASWGHGFFAPHSSLHPCHHRSTHSLLVGQKINIKAASPF